MALCTVGNIFDDVRMLLHDTQVVGGETFTNAYLLGTAGTTGNMLGEPYRTLYSKITGASKRVQPNVRVVLPLDTSVLIPETYNIVDFSEPELIEERSAGTQIAITSTDTSTPIVVTTATPHGLSTGTEGAVSGVANTSAPWGNWYVTVTGTTTFTLNGSASDGISGSGGAFYVATTAPFTPIWPVDFAGGLDGQPQGVLGNYLWSNNRLQFRGCSNPVELRITYNASGTVPTNVNYQIAIDNCRDFLAYGTAVTAARSQGWLTQANEFRNKAYGDPSHPEELALIDLFFMGQVLTDQRIPRRQQAFRQKRYNFGTSILG